MGVRVIQYFLNLMKYGYFAEGNTRKMLEVEEAVENEEGLKWIRDHIHTFMVSILTIFAFPLLTKHAKAGWWAFAGMSAIPAH